MTATNPLEQLLTFADVAKVLNVSIRTVRRLVKSNQLPVVPVRGRLRVRPDDLKSFIALSRVG